MNLKKFSDFLLPEEAKESTAVMSFGRHNPITTGHEKLLHKVSELAKEHGASAHVFTSHTEGKKDPLPQKDKIGYLKKVAPKNVEIHGSSKESPSFLHAAKKLSDAGHKHLIMVAGSDRTEEYHKLLHQYNGKPDHHNFKSIKVVSAGHRDPDAEGTEGISGTKMRSHAHAGNHEEFKKGLPKALHPHTQEIMDKIRAVKEDIDTSFDEFLTEGVHDKGVLKAVFLAGGPGSGKDFVMKKTTEGHGLIEINSDMALEYLMDKNKLDKKMPADEEQKRNEIRGRAKTITDLKKRLALQGRNGLVINSTGDDPQKIIKIDIELRKLGYDTHMLFVDTKNEVSAARNIERGQRGGRSVPESIRKEKWEKAQSSKSELKKHFGDDHFDAYDNSDDMRKSPLHIMQRKMAELDFLSKKIKKHIEKPVETDVGKSWVVKELRKKDREPIEQRQERSIPESSKAGQQAKAMGLEYYGFGRYGKGKHVTHHSVHDSLVAVKDISKINEEFELFEAGEKPKPVGVSQKQTLARQAKDIGVQKANAMATIKTQNDSTKQSFDARIKAIRQAAAQVHESKELDVSTPSESDVAKKDKVSLSTLRKELKKGVEDEKEHTTKDSVAKEIALDHMNNKGADYYDKLKKAGL